MENETYIKRNGDFLMRELTEADLEQFNDLLRYAFQVTTDELVKSGWEDDEIKYAKTPVLKSAYVLGWFYKGTLASMVVVYPMRVNIYDEIYEMGGITGVATYPEYAGRGLIHSLMKHALRHMRENGQSISFLYPYSIPFYRKQGWEIASDKITYTIKDTQLPKMRPVAGMVKRVDLDDEDLRNVHRVFHHAAPRSIRSGGSWNGKNTGVGTTRIWWQQFTTMTRTNRLAMLYIILKTRFSISRNWYTSTMKRITDFGTISARIFP